MSFPNSYDSHWVSSDSKSQIFLDSLFFIWDLQGSFGRIAIIIIVLLVSFSRHS